MLSAVLVLTIPALVAASPVGCPAARNISPLGCVCDPGGLVQCRDVADAQHLQLIMAVFAGYDLEEFVLKDSTLDYLPADLFDSVKTQTFGLFYSTLNSLTKIGNDTSLFSGSGIRSFILDYTDVIDGDISQLRHLDDLEHLTLHGYRRPLDIEGLAKSLVSTANLRSLFLENIPYAIWSGTALRRFQRLQYLSLSGMELKRLLRSDLPTHLGDLEFLRLKNNKLTSLPADFLKGMDSLETLDLSNNKIERLNEATFANFKGSIGLQGNPLRCDWFLEWLRKRLQEGSLKLMPGQVVSCSDGTPLV